MGFADAVRTCLSKYATFSGRARRSEYWFFYLFFVLVALVGSVLDAVLGTAFIAGLIVVALLLPMLAANVRRLHDTSRSGWWLLLGFVPLVGGIVLLVFSCLDSVPEPNQYGPSPKHAPQDGYGVQPTQAY